MRLVRRRSCCLSFKYQRHLLVGNGIKFHRSSPPTIPEYTNINLIFLFQALGLEAQPELKFLINPRSCDIEILFYLYMESGLLNLSLCQVIMLTSPSFHEESS